MRMNEILSAHIQKRVDTDMQLINCILQKKENTRSRIAFIMNSIYQIRNMSYASKSAYNII
jgi:hypothetical protein